MRWRCADWEHMPWQCGESVEQTETIILGGGLAGLALASELKGRALVLESGDAPGACAAVSIFAEYGMTWGRI